MWRDRVGQLRAVGWGEGASFLALLGVAMPLKYLAGWPAGVRAVGMIHGGLFVLYLAAAARAGAARRWPGGMWLAVMGAAFVPGGPFLIDRRLRREEARLVDEKARAD